MTSKNFPTKVIEPGQDAWFVDGDQIFTYSPIAVSQSECVFAASLNGRFHDDSDFYSRFYKFNDGAWSCVEIYDTIISLSVSHRPEWIKPGIVVLLKGGRILSIGDYQSEEQVEFGQFNPYVKIQEVFGTLYVMGRRGQILRKDHSRWVHDDKGIHGFERSFFSIGGGEKVGIATITGLHATSDGLEQYAFGSTTSGNPALFWRKSGGEWEWLTLRSDIGLLAGMKINSMLEQDLMTFWIATNQGYFLKGNRKDGFVIGTDVMRSVDGNSINFTNAVSFEGRIYAGGDQVCIVRDCGQLEPLYGPAYRTVEERETLEKIVSGVVQVADGVLWAMGFGILSKHCNGTWERFEIPEVYHYE